MDILLPVVSTIGTIQKAIADDKMFEGEVKNKFKEVMQEMRLIARFIKSYPEGGKHGLDIIAELQNLAYDIEDFKDLHDHKPKSSLLGRVFFMDTRQEDIKRMDSFMGRIAKLREWMVCIEGRLKDGPRGEPPRGEPGYALNARARIEAPVGMEEHLRALKELLADDNAEAGQLRVVSVVGCRGVGKTTLAWGLYQRRDSLALGGQLCCCAWVEMKAPQGSDARSLLTDIICQVSSQHASNSSKDEAAATDVNSLCTTLHGYLQGYRYFIVIDDLRDWEVWEDVKSAFPNDTSSIIVVTTSFQSVATACSSSSYVYKLKGLDTNGSSRLLWDNVIGESNRHKKYNLHPDLEEYFKEIIRKCDGLPMAVLTVAKFLKRKRYGRSPDVEDCKEAIRLSKHLSKGSDPDFKEMQRVLDECYEGLPNYNLKTCLLSISMFPHGHQIKIKSLERRWMAEGLVARTDEDVGDEELDSAYDALKELVNRSIIEPVQDGSMVNLQAELKRCLVHGVMLEYLVGKSISRNYVCLIKDGKILFNKQESSNFPTRRLSVHDTTVVTDAKMLGPVRSLTIVEKEEEPADAAVDPKTGRVVDRPDRNKASVQRSQPLRRLVDYIQGCKLLRVLDIHKCRGVDDNVLRRICDLQLLRYLSLRGTDARWLPRKMGRLRDLETLDVRDLQMSEPMDLPLEVILLPRLVYLFGKFKLPDDLHKSKAAKGGQLHTLAGFVVTKKKKQSFAYILKHTNKLKKLKIWWTENEDMPNDLATQLMESLELRSFGSNHLDSLSLDFGNQSLDFLDNVTPTVPWTISTIKLRGKLSKLPGFINGKNSLSEVQISQLHLLQTRLGCHELSILQRLPKLKYLKIVDVDGTVDSSKEVDSAADDFGKGVFTVDDGGFPFLEGLFIEATRLPEMTIGSNAMQQLTTLELHCTDVSGFQVTAIENLASLAHVVLKPSPRERAAWKAAAKKNINCPRVEFL